MWAFHQASWASNATHSPAGDLNESGGGCRRFCSPFFYRGALFCENPATLPRQADLRRRTLTAPSGQRAHDAESPERTVGRVGPRRGLPCIWSMPVNHPRPWRQEFTHARLASPRSTAQDLNANIWSNGPRHLPRRNARRARKDHSGENGKALFYSKGALKNLPTTASWRCQLRLRAYADGYRGRGRDVEYTRRAYGGPDPPASNVSRMRDLTSFPVGRQFFQGSGMSRPAVACPVVRQKCTSATNRASNTLKDRGSEKHPLWRACRLYRGGAALVSAPLACTSLACC